MKPFAGGRDDSKCIGSILGGEDSRIMNKDDLKEDCFYRIQVITWQHSSFSRGETLKCLCVHYFRHAP
jgi:hypothetical protein